MKLRFYISASKQQGTPGILSRLTPGLLRALFEFEVPNPKRRSGDTVGGEEAGNRSKVAVYGRDPNIDPVGACVGARGSVQAVVKTRQRENRCRAMGQRPGRVYQKCPQPGQSSLRAH